MRCEVVVRDGRCGVVVREREGVSGKRWEGVVVRDGRVWW